MVSKGQIHLNIFNHSKVCACGNSGDIAVSDIRGGGEFGELHLLAILCAKCAAERIPKLPYCTWLQIVALLRPGAKHKKEWRKYKVHSLNGTSNRASVVIIDGSNQFLGGLRHDVRYDALSAPSRAIDATFQLFGTPLEIELFERSGQELSDA